MITHSRLPDGGITAHGTIDAQLPSPAEKAALAGTLGPPGPNERYITEGDAPATPAAERIVRLASDGALHLPAGADVYIGALKGLLASLQGLSVYTCSAALTLTTSLQNVSGCTTGAFTPATDETAIILIYGVIDQGAGTAPCNAGDQIVFRATDASAGAAITTMIHLATGSAGTLNGLRAYLMSLSAATEYTITLGARNGTGARGQAATTTQLIVWRVAR